MYDNFQNIFFFLAKMCVKFENSKKGISFNAIHLRQSTHMPCSVRKQKEETILRKLSYRSV